MRVARTRKGNMKIVLKEVEAQLLSDFLGALICEPKNGVIRTVVLFDAVSADQQVLDPLFEALREHGFDRITKQ